jgi:hypothetical protein
MALRANMAGGFKSASTPENPDNPWFFSENATGSRAQFALGPRAPGRSRGGIMAGAALHYVKLINPPIGGGRDVHHCDRNTIAMTMTLRVPPALSFRFGRDGRAIGTRQQMFGTK